MNLRSTCFKLKNAPIIPDCFGVLQDIGSKEQSLLSDKPEIISSICEAYNFDNIIPLSYKIFDFSNSHERKIHYYYTEIVPGEKIYFFCNIICSEDTEVSMILSSYRYLRIWQNGELLTITGKKNSVTIFTLYKGNNILCFEQLDAQIHHEIGIRIAPLSYEKQLSSLVNNGGYQDQAVTMYYEITNKNDAYNILYMFIPRNSVQLYNGLNIHYSLKVGEETIKNDISGLYKKEEVIIKQSDILKENILSYIKCDYSWDSNDSKDSAEHIMYVGNIKSVISRLSEKHDQLLVEKKILNEDKLILQYYFDQLKWSEWFDNDSICYIQELNAHLDRIIKGEFNNIYSPGFHRIIFESKLDHLLMSYNVRIPQNYDSQKSYPLFMIFQISYNENRCFQYFDIECLNDAIVAEVSSRGITLGSYIGDASIKEIFKEITNNYNIDFTRIYSTGHSNGSFASWIQAQLTPHQYAGIYPSSSAGKRDLLCNLINTKIFSVTSDMDTSYKYSKANGSTAYDCLEGFCEICADQYTHSNLPYINKNKYVIEKLLQCSVNRFPTKIQYVTDRHRYLQAYWVTIHSIKFAARYGKFDAEYSKHEIIVNCQDVNGVTIEIPPDVDKKHFSVIINGEHFLYHNYEDYILNYSIDCDRNTVIECKNSSHNDFYIHKGNGLLDVYLTPLNIVVCDAQNQVINEVATKFSKPVTNGQDPEILVQYPIYTIEQIYNKVSEYKNGLVILDHCCEKLYLDQKEQISSKFNLLTNKEGYVYKGKKYKGKYLVMQVMNNPYNEGCSILYINTNDESMYKKCLFTRKVIIPSYFSGYHFFLNNSALIFNGEKYFAIKEWGMEIEKVQDIKRNNMHDIL